MDCAREVLRPSLGLDDDSGDVIDDIVLDEMGVDESDEVEVGAESLT